MIKGIHAMLYSTEPDEARSFFRDVMGLQWFDSGDGWLIFNAQAVELGVHPGDKPAHDISFYCDEIETTVREMKAKGAEFVGDIVEAQYGRVAVFIVPGAGEVQLYQPKY